MGLLLKLVVRLSAEQLSSSTLYVRKGGQRGPRYPGAGVRSHASTLLRFQISVENSLVTL